MSINFDNSASWPDTKKSTLKRVNEFGASVLAIGTVLTCIATCAVVFPLMLVIAMFERHPQLS